MLPVMHIYGLAIPSYGLCMAVGIIIACFVAFFRLRSRGGTFDSLLMIVAIALVLGLSCAKVSFYLFSYGINRLFSEIFAGDFSAFQESGLVYYGGLIGGIVGAIIAINAFHYDFDLYVNAIVPIVPLGHAFGRIGCLLAGCCYGLHYEGILAVHSAYVAHQETLFPIQAVESITNIALFVFLSIFTKKQRNGIVTLIIYIFSYSIIRFVLEFFRGDLIRGIFWGLSTSQWISLLLLPLCLIALFKLQNNN